MTRFWRIQAMALAGGMLAAGPLWWTRYEVVKRVNPVRYAEAAQPEETAPPTPQHTLAMEQRAA